MYKKELTLWVGGLDPKVDEKILYELFSYVAPIYKLKIPNKIYENFDQTNFSKSNYAFIEFYNCEDLVYAQKIMDNIHLYNRPITCTTIYDREIKQKKYSVWINNLNINYNIEKIQEFIQNFTNNKNFEFRKTSVVIKFDTEENAKIFYEKINLQFFENIQLHCDIKIYRFHNK